MNHSSNYHTSLAMIFILACVSAGTLLAQRIAPAFTKTSFDRVIITETDFPSPESPLSTGWEVGKPVPAAFATDPDDSHRAMLSVAETDTLYRWLVSPKSYRYGASMCFVPRLAIFFLKGSTLVNHVAVCLECNRLKSDVPIKPAAWPKNSLNPKGLSVAMRYYLSALIIRHGFRHGIDGSSVWDTPVRFSKRTRLP